MKERKLTPPRLFLRFFRWYCHPKLLDHIEGDLIEVYRQRFALCGRLRFLTDIIFNEKMELFIKE